MEIQGKKIIILIADMFNILEFWYPYYRLQEAGAEITVVGTEAGMTYSGKGGTEFKAEAAASQIDPLNYDGVVIPGGYAPDIMRRDPAMVKIVADLDHEGKVVAAICHAGWMLASAKILKDRNVTSYFAIKDDLVHAGARWVDEEVVVDGGLITSRTPDDLPVFMRTVIQAVKGT
jgi:protease I